ncbi:peptidylprolyl isomerase family protein FPR2 ASCRUDRAFT_77340 [Ascoidea rubescens DSM 1968]|uniref:peptidylprolyl isomerase n=1 Tax=Ascoidea rubescens DSM 1968 TaxID=1344418 RepID=A0A1D2VCB4_9ASCO|nr:hypothetical protein ASCRUDRAFT_77340 [Ascoidea rubescens DSM 1968]ODV59271.1 hypothetical protein ASCRUDRAFT_77340 [Ascoidea rubescens DSM 1968]
MLFSKVLISLSSLLFCVVAEGQLRIGITHKIAEEKCTEKSKPGDVIQVHYIGTLSAGGDPFDSSYSRGTPIEFTLGAGNVIKGWDQGLIGMCVGEKRKLTIPSHLAYGERGAGNVIPPNATLVFKTELVKIVKSQNREEL